MDAIPRFTKSDIVAIKEARDALSTIDCRFICCNSCPLYLNSKCISNHLGYIARQAEIERGQYYGN